MVHGPVFIIRTAPSYPAAGTLPTTHPCTHMGVTELMQGAERGTIMSITLLIIVCSLSREAGV